MLYDPKSSNYLANIPYIISSNIYEYDISKANISILFYKGVIDKYEHDMIASFPREKRQIYIGFKIRNSDKARDALEEGFAEFRERFLVDNSIDDSQLLSVKKDSFFLVNIIPKKTKFDNIEFVLKNIYNIFFRLGRLEIYYRYEPIEQIDIIDIKGINDIKLELHSEFFLSFLCQVLYMLQNRTIEETIVYIQQFHNDYINRRLPVGFYREFNDRSLFHIHDGYALPTILDEQLKYIDISFNIKIIMELYKFITSFYL